MTFSERNRRRSEAPDGFNHPLNSWTLSDWMTALTGEVGEAANIVKKLKRIADGLPNRETADELRSALGKEIGDIYAYLDLFSQAAGFDLKTVRDAKFEEVSRRIGYTEPCLPAHSTAASIDSVSASESTITSADVAPDALTCLDWNLPMSDQQA